MEQFYPITVTLIYVLTTWTTFNVNGDNAIMVARKGTRTILPCVNPNELNDVSSLSWIKTSTSNSIVVFNKFEDDLVFPRPDKYSVSYSYQLEIFNVNASDAGSYKCDYRKSASVISRNTELYVPEMHIEECIDVAETTCLVDGSSKDSLTCTFSGFPANIRVSWELISGDEAAVLVEQRFSSNGKLVTTHDKETKNTSFACRVIDDIGGNSSRYAPFEHAVSVNAGYANIPGNKTDCEENTTIIIMGVAMALLIIMNVIVIICWKRRRDSKKDRGYSQEDRKSDQEGQQMLKQNLKTKKAMKANVALSADDSVKCMAATPDGMMAVGYTEGEWGIKIYTANGQLHRKALEGVNVHGIGFLSNGRCVVVWSTRPATNETTIRGSLYTQDWNKVDDEEFVSMIWNDGWSNDLTVDSDDHIYVYNKKKKIIMVFPPNGGLRVREITCDWYTPDQKFAMQSSKKVVVQASKSALVINESGDVGPKLTRTNGSSVYPAVGKDDTILLATVSEERDRVTIDHYTSELKYEATLIKDHEIDKSDKHYYYLQEFTSGEIAFCTPGKLYIFSDGV